MSRVFISYARADAAEADALRAALAEQGVEARLDRATLRPGDSWAELILSDLENADAIVALVSPDSLESTWVEREIVSAIAGGKRVVPVILGVDESRVPPLLSDLVAIEGGDDWRVVARQIADAIQPIDGSRDRRVNSVVEAAPAAVRVTPGSPVVRPRSRSESEGRYVTATADLSTSRGFRLLAALAALVSAVAAVVTILVQFGR